MESTQVIKVKYGDTLRRFTAGVTDNHLDFDMAGLRAKILSLFNLTSDANFELKYVDEDGDLVTLVDDDDLHDAMKQRLKFLRIDVHISNDSGAKSCSSFTSSGSDTTLKSSDHENSSSTARGPRRIIRVRSSKANSQPAESENGKFGTEPMSEVLQKLAKSRVTTGNATSANGSQQVDTENASGATPVVKASVTGNPTSSDANQQVEAENASRAVPLVIAHDALNSVPEPLRESVSKLITELLTSSPVIAQAVDSASKTANFSFKKWQAIAAAASSSKNGLPGKSSSPKARDAGSTSGVAASNASQTVESENVAKSVAMVVTPDSLKSLPENLCDAVSKFTTDLLSYGPVAANIADSISKMGIPSPYFQAHVSAGVNSQNGIPRGSVPSEARRSESVQVDSTSTAGQQVGAGNPDKGFVPGVAPVDLNILPSDPGASHTTDMNATPIAPAVPDGDGKKGKKCTDVSSSSKDESMGVSPINAALSNFPTQIPPNYTPSYYYPFMGVHPESSSQLRRQFFRSMKKSPNSAEASGMFHKGVRCDGCGVYPITGPRFKSKVKENYDLCSICFIKMGNEMDYIKIDRPVYHSPPFSSGAYEHVQPSCFMGPPMPRPLVMQPPLMGSPTSPHAFRPEALFREVTKHVKPKLDSRFVLDVNVIDGTMMAPSTTFTKIWRMRNNGTVVWPKGSQLVWIGGDHLSESHSVYLEVPEEGVPADKELDIAVDFRAPQLPGRYVSYWRMASPSGHKFGQRVWVLIQVDASLKDSFYDSSQGLNLNVPLDVGGSGGPQTIDINVQPLEDDAFLQNLNRIAPTKAVNPMADKQPRQELENRLLPVDATFVGPVASSPAISSAAAYCASAPATAATSSDASYPIIDLSETAPTATSDQQFSAVDTQSTSMGLGGNGSVEETLLKELEEMGFKQVDLNKEILRMNEYNLEQSVDDLCGVSEWDPILEELQEMGFRDNEMNKRLLKKNNGSIKRVVMDLINGGE
ncbi:protein NBR1 homolog [Arachis stenosperma]|uniref:protein NBR1 homolog n=1 Tax=Arachis stenosperma TaxID=217475 RepID=UPI0025AD1514|nr:protein NBR1 homolog [Arachis stenosperma]